MFFQTMFQTMSPGVDYTLTLSRTETKMTVLVMPKMNGLKDTAQDKLVPFVLTGTAAEMDAGFFAAIRQPVARIVGLLTNMAEHEKQANKAAASSKATKETKEETGKPGKEPKAGKKPEEKKSKHEVYMDKATEMETAGNFDGALLQLGQARLHATEEEKKTVDERMAAIKAKMNQGSLFEIPSALQPETAQPDPATAVPQSVATQSAPEQTHGMAPQPPSMTAPLTTSGYTEAAPQPAGQPAGYHQPAAPNGGVQQSQQGAQPHQPYPGYPTMPPHGGHPGMFAPATPNGYGGYPYHAGGYPNGYPQHPHPGGYYNPGHIPGEGCYNPKDYEDIPDVQATHVGQLINPQPQAV
jgi:PRTRC genetic system protein E